jgi:alpha-galactosidase
LEDAAPGVPPPRLSPRRPHADHRDLPVVFNDYMNTLNGDPTTEKLLPLISAAAAVGAEYFCVDAGWYAEQGEGWWDAVGEWKPSTSRFPNGIAEVLDRIRAEGMIAGLWLEPEVVGVRSRLAGELPPEAFFQRDGVRVAEHGRYHLDLRHPAAVAHLDEVVDFLVRELGIGYLKLDYNINAGVGTETGGMSAGAGLLRHNRALLRWLDGVLDRHPGLTLENCASGGMRTDYAMLSRMQLQSTSDQQDFRRYPAIAAAAPAAIAFEQCGNWAYPQPAFTRDEIVFTVCGALLGRLYLSGRLDQMKPEQLDLVAESVDVYKRIRPRLAGSVPFWPLGLPGWNDSWVALGARSADATYVTAWHRGRFGRDAGGPADPGQMTLPIRHLRGIKADVQVVFPRRNGPPPRWDQRSGELTIALPATRTACLVELVHATV